ncbi:MAG TPA: HAD family phosphatase [Blastocatellia bacterium]|nr:HAD family phosphatase [Blastocatellia bacterium]
MLKAIIFDCDGVIADTEPLHLRAFQQVLAEEGITLTKEDYYRYYLAFDDRGCFDRAFSGRARPSTEKLAELTGRKAAYIEPMMRAELRLFPGAVDLIRRAARRYPLAVASGALRREIMLILECGGVKDCFLEIVSAEDVTRGKPDPESFLKAHSALSARLERPIAHRECLVIEDSLHGIEAARLAGMPVLAVATSYPAEELSKADLVVESLDGLSFEALEGIAN